MANENVSFIFSIILVLSGMLYISKLLYFRAKRDVLMKKYKSNDLRDEIYHKFFSIRKLMLAIIVTLLLIINLIFNIHDIVRSPAPGSSLIFGAVVAVVTFSVSVLIAYKMIGLPRIDK